VKWSKTLKLWKGYINFTLPLGRANKKGDALQNLHRFPYSSRHRLLIKLEQAETEKGVSQGNYTFKLKITQTEAQLHCFLPDPPKFSLPSTFKG
jgi:hypothetical protein